jgi:transcriptional regulator with XRE-family HTH domain
MDQIEFGKRILQVRKLLKMSQIEFALAINTRQTLVSRMETKGLGVTLPIIFNLLNLLNKMGYNGKNIFNTQFKPEMLLMSPNATKIGNVGKDFMHIKNSIREAYEKLVLLETFLHNRVNP